VRQQGGQGKETFFERANKILIVIDIILVVSLPFKHSQFALPSTFQMPFKQHRLQFNEHSS